jgi:hypothetical protein
VGRAGYTGAQEEQQQQGQRDDGRG